MARFACATWRPIGANTGGKLASQRGLVLHHQAGNGSLYGFFNNPAAGVSAHFWVGKNGTIEQYVDTSVVAWHGRDLNSNWVGVETEGCGTSPHAETMPSAMESALARIYAEGARVHGWRNQLASSNGGAGFGYHRMAVNTACPCDVRLNRRGPILAVAFGGGAAAPPSTGKAPPLRVDYFGRPHNSTCADVRVWQDKMCSWGWFTRPQVDGIFGPQSEDVAKRFQRQQGLTADGLVGPATWAKTWP
jgi:peptidoglycan hydrolase-like protein with peptidoglycan-binding domain